MKISKILLIIVLVIVLIPVLGFLSWQLKKGHELDIVFINKSMMHYDGTENKSFSWILNNKKILGPGKALYDMETNYFESLYHSVWNFIYLKCGDRRYGNFR